MGGLLQPWCRFARGVECRPVFVAHIAVDNAGLRTTIIIDRHEIVARSGGIFLLYDSLGEYRTVEKRTVAVLLAVEV